jgi:hypothetical protein
VQSCMQATSTGSGREHSVWEWIERPPNKRMKLTKLSAAPGWLLTTVRTEVPPRAPAGRIDGGTASQLIRGVGPTHGGMWRTSAVSTGAGQADRECWRRPCSSSGRHLRMQPQCGAECRAYTWARTAHGGWCGVVVWVERSGRSVVERSCGRLSHSWRVGPMVPATNGADGVTCGPTGG